MIFKIWEELTEPEVNSIKRKLCTKCAHFQGWERKITCFIDFAIIAKIRGNVGSVTRESAKS